MDTVDTGASQQTLKKGEAPTGEEIKQNTFRALRQNKFLLKYGFWLPLLCIVLLASGLRLYALDTYPQRFNQDAMVMGYDAWSIWTTGHDHHGDLFPIFFRTFNDYVLPVPNYIVAPFVGILGLNEMSVRIPFALMGIVTVFLVALLGRRWFNAPTGLIAALLLAIDPWHVNYSRIAHPVGCVTFFVVVGLYCFTRGTALLVQEQIPEQKRWSALVWLSMSAIAFALLTGSYSTLKLEAPLLLGACLVAFLPYFWRNRTRFGWLCLCEWLALYAILVFPLALSLLLHWHAIQSRYDSMSVFNQKHWIIVFLTQYANHFNPGALFFDGFKGGLAIHPAGVGELFWLEWPLWIVATIGLSKLQSTLKRLGFNLHLLIIIWFVTFPIASSLTTLDVPHELRSLNFLPLPELLAAYGAVVLWQALSRYRWKWFSAAQGAMAGALVILMLFNVLFLRTYFAPPLLNTNATADQIPYNVGLRDVLNNVMPQVGPCDIVWLEPDNQTYIYYLFLTKYPASTFQRTSHEVDQPLALFNAVGQVHFGIPDATNNNLLRSGSCKVKPSRTFFIARNAQIGPGWREIFTIKNGAGISIWRVLVRNN